MPKKARAGGYLAKAKDADERSQSAKDEISREGWKLIAEGYRELARRESNHSNE